MTTLSCQVRYLVSGQSICVLEPEDVFKEPEGLIYEDDISRDSLLRKTTLPGFLGTYAQVLTELTDKYLSARVGGTLNFSSYSLKKIFIMNEISILVSFAILASAAADQTTFLPYLDFWGFFNDNSTRKQICSIDIYPFPKLIY